MNRSGSIASTASVASLTVSRSGIAVTSLVAAGVATGVASGAAARSTLNIEVGETVLLHDVGDTLAGSVKGRSEGLGRVGVLGSGTIDGRINQRHDATEFGGGGKTGVAADVRQGAGGKRVEVLLRVDEGSGSSNDLGVVAQIGDDLVGQLELITRVAGAQKDAGGRTGQGGSLARATELAETLDRVLDQALLAETGLGKSQEDGESSEFGVHGDDVERRLCCKQMVLSRMEDEVKDWTGRAVFEKKDVKNVRTEKFTEL